MTALQERFASAAQFKPNLYEWHQVFPRKDREDMHIQKKSEQTHQAVTYVMQEKRATRQAYGQALVVLGAHDQRVISLDAEVKNSTFAELFEQAYPERFIQCFIAEQNMIGMAIGLYKRGSIPFASTFAAFFSRCYDQIRMAAISKAALRLVGSHAGVSIGEDGPSQMGLEDIACMRAIPQSCVLYPADAVSTTQLVQEMAHYNQGISYLRTTRMATPIIYTPDTLFVIGGCHVLQQSDTDSVCIVAAGITVHEALKAYEILKKENINIAIIDLYSIKPLDAQTIISVAKKANNRIITVEDHYLQGGVGEAVVCALKNTDIHIDCLAVPDIPRSGTPQQLLAWAGIDAQAIVQEVKKKG